MSLEVGGRSDKLGNHYENMYLAKLLIRLVEESLASIEVEPLGAEGKGVEYIAEKTTGERLYYQCKASNGANNHWSATDLNNLNIFTNAKTHIMADMRNEYHFISPIPYDGLDELCNRARTNHDAKSFVALQLSNTQLRNAFLECEKYFGLSRDIPNELNDLLYILAHCRFELVPDNQETVSDLESIIGMNFVGKAEAARMLLENCVNDNRWYGTLITPQQVASYMEENGFPARTYGADGRIWPRIDELNTTYWGNYSPINGELISREASQKIVCHLKDCESVVLHGRAGSGKSGCVEEVIHELVKEQIPYLAIKLDKHIPVISADEYGRTLGLSESPVHSLAKVSAGNPCVLILDQLDSLRWTASHSAIALAVCKEMIKQANVLRQTERGKVSILFVTRTFDYKQDNGIKGLFSRDQSHNRIWNDVELGLFSDEETKKIIGPDYDRLSPRLQRLLHTPSSLYVWTQLQDSNRLRSIVSINQLMGKWWEQILKNCEAIGLPSSNVEDVVKTIAAQMSSGTLFALPRRLLSSKGNIIDALISNGLLTDHATKVSFSHQSFLDYFLATEMIQKILDGNHLIDSVGDRDDQTPNLRYRLLSILQGLSEVNDELFLEECRSFLDSESVRYYYKCAVFEAIAQYDSPSVALMDFTKLYLLDEKWREYVQQVVYAGNLPFVIHLANRPPFTWISDQGLWLLGSISNRAPDFVVDTLREYAFQNPDNNQKVYRALCHDVSEDSGAMYALRMQLLETDESLFEHSWFGFYNSFKKSPERCVDYLKLLLQKHDAKRAEGIHLPEEKILKQFSEDNAELVVGELLPVLCHLTDGFGLIINEIAYSDHYSKWGNMQYSHGHLRKIVQIVVWAMRELGEDKPEMVFQIDGNDAYYKSLLGNELLLAAFERMPLECADSVIEWTMKDFPLRFFDYTSVPSNFLETGKRILNRFSPHCSKETFFAAEQAISRWKDDAAVMVNIFKVRISRTKEGYEVYYPFWGHMQKELLPALDAGRLSRYAGDLLRTLERNTWIRNGHYHAYPFSGPAKTVVSPVDGYASRLSDKTWLKIIRTPTEKMVRHRIKETEKAYVEATPFTFSSALRNAARSNPKRFALLSLQFPLNCHAGYISAVLCAVREQQEGSMVADIDLTCEVIRRFWTIEAEQVRRDIADILQKRAEENWPHDILDILQRIALMPQEPLQWKRDGREVSGHDLHTEAINRPRGCALTAMESLLWKHIEMGSCFRDVLELTKDDDDASVRFATAMCSVPFYNIDAEYSKALFRYTLSKDLRTFAIPGAWEILYRDFDENTRFYVEKLVQACQTEDNQLSKSAAGFACALAVFYANDALLDFVLTNSHTDDMVRQICIQAAATFGNDDYHEVSKHILLQMATNYDTELALFSRDFFKEKIDIRRDAEFLQQIVGYRSGSKNLYSFMKYLSETDEDITCFADMIKAIGDSLTGAHKDFRDRLIVEDLIQCVIQLFDRGKNDPRIRGICLDVWDVLFQNNLREIKPLADMLDNYD